MSYKSRFPEIIAALKPATALTEDDVADRVVTRAQARVPRDTGKLANSIHKERAGEGVMVLAGDEDVFYGHIVEHGGVYTAPRPFLVPAAEETRQEVEGLGRKRLKDL